MTSELTRTHYTNTVDLLLAVNDNYSYHVRQFANWLQTNARGLEAQSIIDYFTDLNARTDYTAGTKRIKRQAVKARLRQLQRMGELGSEFSERLDQFLKDLDHEPQTRAPKTNTSEVGTEKVLGRDEYLLILDAAPQRIAAMLEFLWTTGCRVSEMLGIRRGDIDVDEREARIRINGKGSKERMVRLPAGLYHQIRDTYQGEEYLFETRAGGAYSRSYVSREIARLGRRVLRRRISAHTLRHSFATRMIGKTHKTKAVSRYLGHSSTSITLNMYVHESLEASELFGDELR